MCSTEYLVARRIQYEVGGNCRMDSSRIATSTLLQTSLGWSSHICERRVQKVVGLVKKPTELDFLRQETRSSTRKVGHSSQCHSWDLNREPPKFEAPSLLITPLLKIAIIIIIITITISYFLKSSFNVSPYLPAADFRVSPPAVVFAASPQVLFVVRLVIVNNVIVIGGGCVAVSRPRAFHCRRQHGWT